MNEQRERRPLVVDSCRDPAGPIRWQLDWRPRLVQILALPAVPDADDERRVAKGPCEPDLQGRRTLHQAEIRDQAP